MKIAVSANGKDLDSKVDLRFGRATGFIIYNLDDESFDFINNIQNLEAAQGAGIQAAQTVANQNVDALITGHCGPKAFKVFLAANIKIYTGAEGTIIEAIKKFKNNELMEALSPDVEGHWV
ncbi:MAG: dinitrogenase iron-molybdenum cofactor biosynthesis protein [Candidatus Melainabacteria bacterium RIFOXYA12_FULL_32_12]|nr:MAG: dinitrogenase iron-molybdenum cofactor biosynthesis protein [Candidatus Melainabacteria bacterium RIFOXYA12_FULL_32_12]